MSEWISPYPRPANSKGFTYLITNTINNRMYIGFKTFMKGWENYYGSCIPLTADIKLLGKENFTREILEYYRDINELQQQEKNLQIKHDVLRAKFPDGSRMYYNGVISGVGFNGSGRKGCIPHNKGKPNTTPSPLKGKPSGKKGISTGKPSPLKGRKQPTISAKLKGVKRPYVSVALTGRPSPLRGRTQPITSAKLKGRIPHNKGVKQLYPSPLKGKPASDARKLSRKNTIAKKTPEEIAATNAKISNSRKGVSRSKNSIEQGMKTVLEIKRQTKLFLIYVFALQIHFNQLSSKTIESIIEYSQLTPKQKELITRSFLTQEQLTAIREKKNKTNKETWDRKRRQKEFWLTFCLALKLYFNEH